MNSITIDSLRPHALSALPVRAVLLSLAILLTGAAIARAEGPSYVARTPTPGALYSDGQNGRYLLGGEWLYRPDLSDVGIAEGWWRDAASTNGWSPVAVPNAYNAGDFTSASNAGYTGWYRKDFKLPNSAFARYVPRADRRWIIRFESVNYRATVWLNGRKIGGHAGAELPFELDLPDVRKGVNRLIVRVNNRRSAMDIPPGYGGGAWNYGGILREVYVRTAQRADISQTQYRTLLPCPSCAAKIEVTVQVRNVTGAPQAVGLHGVYGNARLTFGRATISPYATWTTEAVAHIPHPNLWSPGHPALYRSTLTLTDSAGRKIGGYVELSGIRTITVTPDGRLELNGRLLNLRGVDVREQNLAQGGALDATQERQIVSSVKALGGTVMRSDPLSPELEEAADRAGILIWSEIPVNRTVQRQYLGDPAWVAEAHSFLRQNILANENHPSVLLWSIGNELPTYATPAEASYIASSAALAKQLDPTRPVAMSITDWPGVPCQAAYAPLDVIGYNDYFGWFDFGDGGTADQQQLSPFLDSLRACYPHQALAITEFGFDANRAGPAEEYGTYQFQADAAEYHLQVFATKPWLSAAMYFLLQDTAFYPGYTGGNPEPDPPFNEKGLLDLDGNPKPAWAVVSSIFHATVQIANQAHGTRGQVRNGAGARRRKRGLRRSAAVPDRVPSPAVHPDLGVVP